MKGYKGFEPGMICRGKQYQENMVFEEDEAVICNKGMHFCKNPFSVLDYYPFVNEKAEINDFAEVEGENEITEGDKSVTKKLRVGAKIGIPGLIKAFVEYTIGKNDKTKKETNTGYRSAATNTGDQSAATNTGYQSAATNTGDQSAATNTGNRSAATNTGDQSAATVEGKGSVAIVIGYESKARAGLGGAIVICERGEWNGIEFPLLHIRSAIIDGKRYKPGVWYTVKNGRIVKAEN